MFSKKRNKPRPQVQRRPGQSLREQWEQLIDDRLIPIVFVPGIIWVMTFAAWVEAWSRRSLVTFWLETSIVATALAVIAYLRLLPKARNLVRGECGERLVAEHLEELRAAGYHCFHDLVQDGFNVDHVVVGPAGVFVVETKFRSGSGVIEFRNGEGIFVDGRPEERDPLKQARGSARAVHELIQRDAGFSPWVKPLVVFVGDWKVRNSWRDTDAHVLTVKQIPDYFRRQDQPELIRREIDLICSHLKRSVRSS